MDPPEYPSCLFVDPTVVTCYPTNQTLAYQNQYTRVIWNTQYALFFTNDGNGLIDLYLRNADTDKAMGKWNATRQSGSLSLLVDDSWWDNRAVDQWTGQVRNWTFYWIIAPGGMVLNGGEAHQPTFIVAQTALPNYAISSSASMNSDSRSPSSEESTTSLSKAQSSGGNGFPTWAIALVVVLGVVTLTCILSLVFVLRRYSRRKQHREDRNNLMGSESSMMAAPAASAPLPIMAASTADTPSLMMAAPTASTPSPMMVAPIVAPLLPMMAAPDIGPSSPMMVAPTAGPSSPMMVAPTVGPSSPITHESN